MVKVNSFVVDVDEGEPLVSVHLDFHTSRLKDLNDAIGKLVAARNRLQTVYTLEDERDD